MEKFIWEDKYSIGIRSIDEQHKHFFELANGIIDLYNKQNFTVHELSNSIREFENYAFGHLGNEEGYFDKLHYKDAPIHIDDHNLFRKKIEYFATRINKSDVNLKELAEEVASYAVYWLSDHIFLMDKKYATYFKEHGVS